MLPGIIMNDNQLQAGTNIIIIYKNFQTSLNHLFYLEAVQNEAKSQIMELIFDSQ